MCEICVCVYEVCIQETRTRTRDRKTIRETKNPDHIVGKPFKTVSSLVRLSVERSAAFFLQVSCLELDGDVLSSQCLVAGCKAGDLVLDACGVLCVDEDLDELGAVDGLVVSLADNLRRVDEVLEDGVVDRSQCAGAGSWLLGSVGAAAWLGQDAALGNDEHRLVAELLLEFTDEPVKQQRSEMTIGVSVSIRATRAGVHGTIKALWYAVAGQYRRKTEDHGSAGWGFSRCPPSTSAPLMDSGLRLTAPDAILSKPPTRRQPDECLQAVLALRF